MDESDNEENYEQPDVQESDAEEFTPAPQRSPRRQGRRKTTDVPSTPRIATRTRKARTGESIEPSQIFVAQESIPSLPASPTKKGSPRKRKGTAPTKKERVSSSTEPPQLPTPQPSVTPDLSQLHGTPLGDITLATINEQGSQIPATQQEIKKIKPLDAVLEKPMDIVIRTRALGVPSSQVPIASKSRTVIRYLILTNFKSYAGQQRVGPFHSSFSSVVGPNGSGKSNVIDSLLFVFGFRASKMRQGKISALIHNSANFPDLDFCEVQVHFQEVVDLVRRFDYPQTVFITNFSDSPTENMKLCLTLHWSFHEKHSRTTPANIISTLMNQILQPLRHYFAIEEWIWTINVF